MRTILEKYKKLADQRKRKAALAYYDKTSRFLDRLEQSYEIDYGLYGGTKADYDQAMAQLPEAREHAREALLLALGDYHGTVWMLGGEVD